MALVLELILKRNGIKNEVLEGFITRRRNAFDKSLLMRQQSNYHIKQDCSSNLGIENKKIRVACRKKTVPDFFSFPKDVYFIKSKKYTKKKQKKNTQLGGSWACLTAWGHKRKFHPVPEADPRGGAGGRSVVWADCLRML